MSAVVVATPTSTHYPCVRGALQAGKHVMVEETYYPTMWGRGWSCDQSWPRRRLGRVLLVGSHVFVWRRCRAARTRQYLSEGALGRVYYISMQRTNLGPIRVDAVNTQLWDLASHDVSIVNYWLGAEPSVGERSR